MKVIDIGKDFSRYPVGRYVDDGPYTGQAFRQKFLEPAFEKHEPVKVVLDNTAGYGSSFLEEAFGGLVRKFHCSAARITDNLELETTDPSLRDEILEYIREAEE